MNNSDKPKATEEQKQALAEILGPLIFAYTRADAIADGVLRPVPELDLSMAGINLPLCVNESVWIAARADELACRLSMLTQTRRALKNAPPNEDRCYFEMFFPDRALMEVVIHCGPGDNGEPVLTLCEPQDL